VVFPEKKAVSLRIPVFSAGIVQFDAMDLSAVLSFETASDMAGRFVWSFADPGHSASQLLLRSVFFFVAMFLVVRLCLSGFGSVASRMTVQLMFVLDALVIVASDPCYVLVYFTESRGVRVFDALANLLLVVCVQFAGLVALLGAAVNRSPAWLAIRFLPFLASYALFAGATVYATLLTDGDPTSQANGVTMGLGYTKLFLLVVNLLALLYAVVTCTAEREAVTMAILSLVSALSACRAELKDVFEPMLVNESTTGILALATCSIYVVFFNFFNWPVTVDDGPVRASAAEEDAAELGQLCL